VICLCKSFTGYGLFHQKYLNRSLVLLQAFSSSEALAKEDRLQASGSLPSGLFLPAYYPRASSLQPRAILPSSLPPNNFFLLFFFLNSNRVLPFTGTDFLTDNRMRMIVALFFDGIKYKQY
jgi:hypothetical protein